MQLLIAQINPTVGALRANTDKILRCLDRARTEGCAWVVFPEMAVCGYPPEDLLVLPSFIDAVGRHLEEVVAASAGLVVVVGCVRPNVYGGEKGLYNTAALIQDRELVGFQDKSLLPDYDVFSERRYFEPAEATQVWMLKGKKVAITICEDMWQHAAAVEYTAYHRDPIAELKEQAPDLLINISASPFALQRGKKRLEVCQAAVRTLGCPMVFCNQVGGNDRLIFDGHSMYLDATGRLLALGRGFEEECLCVAWEGNSRLPALSFSQEPQEELFQALVLGVRDYFHKQGFTKGCLGLSGGIDSAVVACIAAQALGPENVLALALPSRFTAPESLEDAQHLAHNVHIGYQVLSIEVPFKATLTTLAQPFGERIWDVTEENLQSRIRGMLLMAFSNKQGYILLGTGNKSELAMGYTTLYGDLCGGLGVLTDVTKGQVYALARWINRAHEVIPLRTLERAPSAELRYNQKDSDTLPEYSLIDLVLQEYVEEHHSPEEIAQRHQLDLPVVYQLVERIHRSEYKRQQAPPGLRVTKRAFTVGRRFPIVQHWNCNYEERCGSK